MSIQNEGQVRTHYVRPFLPDLRSADMTFELPLIGDEFLDPWAIRFIFTFFYSIPIFILFNPIVPP